MRLGEIRNLLAAVLGDGNQILLKEEQLYGGQAYLVRNFSELSKAIKYLSALSWNDVSVDLISMVLQENIDKVDPVTLSQEQFIQLKKYIDRINSKVPLYFAILETMSEAQDEKTINIKLPDNLETLEDLSEFNLRIGLLFKKFQIDGDFKFNGFDRGSAWLEVIPAGILTYQYFVGCLDAFTKYFEMKKAYFNSKTAYFKMVEAEVHYQAALNAAGHGDEFSQDGVKKYIDQLLEESVKASIQKVVQDIDKLNGQTKESLTSQLVIATKELIRECELGTEFHLSLNPSEFAKESNGVLVIDYKKLRSLDSGSNDFVPQIASPIDEIQNEEGK